MFLSDHPKAGAGTCELKENSLESVSACGVCGCENLKQIGIYKNSPKIHFVKCANCGAVTYDKVLKQSAIDEIYDDDQYYNDVDDAGNITFYGTQRFGKHLLRALKDAKIRDACKILDFGGGDGAVAYSLAKMLSDKNPNASFEITVVDYTSKLYKVGDEKIKMTHMFPLESLSNSGKFDIVIASAVMEHIPVPKNIFSKLFAIVKKDGLIYFRTPYRYPLYKATKHFGIEFDMLYPGHIWDFGGDKWWRMLPQILGLDSSIRIVTSKPSIVEKSFKSHFFIALASHLLKAPWFICRVWPFVGGWEAIYKKD